MASQASAYSAAPPSASAPLPVGASTAPTAAALTLAAPTAPGRRTAPPALHPDLRDPVLYLSRELTWLSFNARVLAEADDPTNPLLERVKFLAITGSNLDEFFMKRIGGLKQQMAAGLHEPGVDGRTPEQQVAACAAVIRDLEAGQRATLGTLRGLLVKEGIHLRAYNDLPESHRRALREQYAANVFPLVTPLVIDPAHPFPLISNLSLNLLVTGRQPGADESLMARVKVPLGFGIARFLQLPGTGEFVPLEVVMAHNLDLLLPGLEVETCELFRVIRNANTERDEETAEDLLELIETELRDRRVAPMVRLEVERGMRAVHRGMLAAELGLDEHTDVVEVEGLLALRDLHEIAALDRPTLHDPPLHPVDHPRLPLGRNIFHAIRDAGSVLLVHPYDAFATTVERFLQEASQDPKVRAVKMTLYRTSSDARIIGYLADAARNGKQVAVVVELKARFDEAANIQFATQLEDLGIHVSYGVLGYKTHCKTILVVRQDYDGLRRYAHIGTGNYHPSTARLYVDLGLFTTDEAIGQDLTELFNFLTTGYQAKRHYQKLLPAPALLKGALLEKIAREARFGSEGHLRFKMNALEDPDIVHALYQACQAGVRVDLVVRDTCRLRPGLPGISETARVVSVVGRFLEHARIYEFRNGGDVEFFIGSADLMKRNLHSRVEALAPVQDEAGRRLLRTLLDLQLGANRDTWTMQPDGHYLPVAGGEDALRGCQESLAEQLGALDRAAPPRRHKRRYARRLSRAATLLD